jgi:DNA-directed RNA polymerase subunit RPC12/RpoP
MGYHLAYGMTYEELPKAVVITEDDLHGYVYVLEHTCLDVVEDSDDDFCCSECGARLYVNTGDTYTMIAADEHTIIKRPNFCPSCGARVISIG